MEDFVTRSINVGRVAVSYLDEGMGQVILLIHGWATSKEIYIPLIKSLKSRYRLIALDLPGFGASQYSSRISSLADYGQFVVEFAKTQGLENYYLFGNSMGGGVVASLLKKKNLNIRGVILRAPLLASKMVRRSLNNFFIKDIVLRGAHNPFFLNLISKLVLIGFSRIVGSGVEDEEICKIIKKVKENAKKCSYIAARDAIADGLRIDYVDSLAKTDLPKLVLIPSEDELLDFSSLPKSIPQKNIAEKHAILKGNYSNLSSVVDDFVVSHS